MRFRHANIIKQNSKLFRHYSHVKSCNVGVSITILDKTICNQRSKVFRPQNNIILSFQSLFIFLQLYNMLLCCFQNYNTISYRHMKYCRKNNFTILIEKQILNIEYN